MTRFLRPFSWRARVGACLLLLGSGASHACLHSGGLTACPSDCKEHGGTYECSTRVIKPDPDGVQDAQGWKYSACDPTPWSTGFWCLAAGGGPVVECPIDQWRYASEARMLEVTYIVQPWVHLITHIPQPHLTTCCPSA